MFGRAARNRDESRRGVRRAFSLIEVLVTIALLATIAAVSWPALETQIMAAELPESAARFRDLILESRTVAINETRRIRIRFAINEQQPYVEIEADPILEPGVWTELDQPWAVEAMEGLLLDDVQVHEIRLGRPAFTKPLSINDQPVLDEQSDSESFRNEDEEDALSDDESVAEFDAGSAQSVMDNAEENIDENRPIILIESDGSISWALVVLSRKPTDEELEDDDPRLWVLMDGRTGITKAMEAIPDEEILDGESDIYVLREDLYLPDLSDLGRLSFKSTGFGGQPGLDEDGDGIPDDTGEGEFGDGFSGEQDGGQGGGQQDGMGGSGDQGSTVGDESLPPELEDSINNSDLTPEERRNIRNAFKGGAKQ